jgi:hypothetical protein
MGKEDLFSEIFSKYDYNVNIDRKEENESVKRFQETGDMSILEDVYIKRIPTLKNWALKFYYPGLELSIDDFMEELSIVFVKAANKYNIEKGSFNTCLYTYLNNRIKNMKNSTHAKKRRPENYDGPISGILLSLDHTYSNDKGGSETTLRDVLTKQESNDDAEVVQKTNFHETVDLLSNGNDILQSVFIKLGEGSTLSSILRDFKTFRGDIRVTSKELKSLESDNYTSLKDIIVKKSDMDDKDFVVVDYRLVGKNKIAYAIEFKDTEEAKLIQKTIKDLRKNKEEYIRKIKQK